MLIPFLQSAEDMKIFFVQFYSKQRHTTSILDDTDSMRNLYQQIMDVMTEVSHETYLESFWDELLVTIYSSSSVYSPFPIGLDFPP